MTPGVTVVDGVELSQFESLATVQSAAAPPAVIFTVWLGGFAELEAANERVLGDAASCAAGWFATTVTLL
jgi:hypothetical protein